MGAVSIPVGRLIFTDLSSNGIEYPLGIEAYALFKHPTDLPDVLNMLRYIPVDNYEIGLLSDFDRADLIFQSKRLRAVVGCDTYSFYGAESRLCQEFDGLL